MNDKRPRYLSDAMKKAAAEQTAEALVKAGHFKADEQADIAKDIARYATGPYQDGYSLAKSLDDGACWDCDLSIAQELDNWSCNARHQIDLAEQEWFERTKPEPPLPIGAKVKLSGHRGDETGEITGIYEHGPAKYLVKIDGDPQAEKSNSRRIVNFEDAKPLEAAQ